MYRKDKRGLSEVITTVLIILLTITAVVIIGVVIRNFISSSSEQIDLTTKCASVELRAVKVNETSPGVYDVTLSRTGTGGTLGGVKISLHHQNGTNTGVLDFNQSIGPLETKTGTFTTTVPNATRLEFTPYFFDKSGNPQLCPQTNEFRFKAA